MSVLERIVASKREELAGVRRRRATLLEGARAAPPVRPFLAPLEEDGAVAVIAEHKRRSPSAGWIREGSDVGAVVAAYRAAGAAAASILTDAPHFGGSLEDLRSARGATGLPLLRKDFLLDPVQVEESRAAGADAVLLIIRLLDRAALEELLAAAADWGMAALVEAHDAPEVERALAAGARMVGINARDLGTFRTDLSVVEDLAGTVPPELILVAESGIHGPDDVDRLGAAGVDAVLVGEALMRAPAPGEALRGLVGRPRRRRTSPGALPRGAS